MAAPPGQAEAGAAADPARPLTRLINWLGWLGVAALLVPTVLICTDIVWRRAVGGAFVDTFDITQLCLVICASWTIPYGFVHGTHVSVGLLVEHLPGRLQRDIEVATHLVAAALFALLSWFGWQSALLHYGYGDTTQNLGLPMIGYWAVFLIGFILAIAACLQQAWLVARQPDTA